jgi:hypothetical protein
MFSVVQSILPEDSLLATFRGGVRPESWGSYGDCFSLLADRAVSLEEFVFAFYTSPVFRIERFLLKVFVSAPSTDFEAHAVASGSASAFAAWYVGERTVNQLLMCDRFEQTRSWFRVLPSEGGRTTLQFGSAVAARRSDGDGKSGMGPGFRLLLGFHVLYSQMLLRGAMGRLAGAAPL